MPFGESISSDIVIQLDKRSSIFEKSSRTEADLKFLTQKNAWVRAISFVNENGSPDASKELVLAGGAASFNGQTLTITNGIQLRQGESVSNPTYRYTLEKGVRPVPGITSFDVKTKGTYGTLKDATIQFHVSTLEDLERVEKLYFRPGFHTLVEWGNTVYVANDGVVQDYVDTDYLQFFQPTVPKRDILTHISTKRSDKSYNYDGFLGLIKNFSWNYRKDGGYDCSISIASLGETVDSLTLKVPGYFETYWDDDDGLGDQRRASRKSEFHLFVYRLHQYKGNNPISTRQYRHINIFRAIAEELRQSTSGNILFALYYEVAPSMYDYGFWGMVGLGFSSLLSLSNYFNEYRVYFISLRTFLAMVNYYIKKYLKNNATVFDLMDGSTYKSFEKHFSLNPLSTLLPKIPTGNAFSLYVYGADIAEDGTAPNFAGALRQLKQLKTLGYYDKAALQYTPPEFEPIKVDECLNILISTRTLISSVEKFFTTSENPREVSFIDLVKDVLSTVNRDLGNVNSLDIEYMEDVNKLIIVDRENTPNTVSPESNLDLTGLRSTILDATISSKISNKLGSQIAIAAQAGKSSYNGSVAKYKQWNENLTDRVTDSFDANNDVVSNTEEQLTKREIDNFLDEIAEAYAKLNEGMIDSELWDSVQVKGENIFNTIIDKYSLSKGQLPSGIIPVEVSLKLDGISGIKVAQTFTIKKGILPEKYSFGTSIKFGFIVNGIEHTIQGNKWITTVSAQAFLIGILSEESAAKQEAINEINDLFNRIPTQNPIVSNQNTDSAL